MSRLNRYFFYTLVFAVVLASIITKSYAVLGLSFLGAILLGLLTEFFDNRREEKYKHYNHEIHNYKH